MFEITTNGSDVLQNFIDAEKVYSDSVYDFTFEGRFIVYHFHILDTIHYAILDSDTGAASELVTKHKSCPIQPKQFQGMTPAILRSIKYTGDRRYLNVLVTNPLDVIDSIFRVVLPEYGFAIRENQIQLSKDMYNGLVGKKIAICEAEVGTGKTMAYLVAAIVAMQQSTAAYTARLPVTITTSSIELQRSIVENEIPMLSRILLAYGLIDSPLNAVIRKGKEHYFCIARFNEYRERLMAYPDKYRRTLNYFKTSGIAHKAMDLDSWLIPSAVKSKICVKGRICHDCQYASQCKYLAYIHNAKKRGYADIQVTNHNMYLAHAVSRRKNRNSSLLQDSFYVVVDEAHKFLGAAQDLFTVQIEEDAITKYVNSVKHLYDNKVDRIKYAELLFQAAKLGEEFSSALHRIYKAEYAQEDTPSRISLSTDTITTLRGLIDTIFQIEAHRNKTRTPYAVNGEQLANQLRTFLKQNRVNIWLDQDENDKLLLCCCPKDVSNSLHNYVWNAYPSFVLTSGTMSDGTDFSYFKAENGLTRVGNHLIFESSTPSPFDYANHTRLYIPKDMPDPNSDTEANLDVITERILQLVEATNGHTAILFTSYKLLRAVYTRTVDRLGKYDVFCMTRKDKTTIREFRKSKNGVLFASGSMWEGVDCPGDSLSSVIIVRLPFPLRSTTMNQKLEDVGDVRQFVQQYAVPEMLIKLRQGAGRLIRTENDTGVISILDGRAAGSYYNRVRKALSKYPTVDSVDEIAEFIKNVKDASYFEDVHEVTESEL